MTSPHESDVERAAFNRRAASLFSAADLETLEGLHPMVQSLQGMADRVSAVVLDVEHAVLSETATGD